MGVINSRVLFFTTSPRTPERMVSEIDLLVKHFSGQPWNKQTQKDFMDVLSKEQFFYGKGENDPALSARDRINRAPKALGFVKLNPYISLTEAGRILISSKRREEIFLRQMLKFQIPSPYHKLGEKTTAFCVKPYLEMLRLVRTLGTLKFDELQIFGMQLTDWHEFNVIIDKIEKFREAKAQHIGSYKTFRSDYFKKELISIYEKKITEKETKVRESKDNSLDKFLKTKLNNMRDYADACFRYLRATGLVNVSHIGKSLSIVPERIRDVDYILDTVDPNPCFINDESGYFSYLSNASIPKLLIDDKEMLINRLKNEFPRAEVNTQHDISQLRNQFAELSEIRKEETLEQQISEIKDRKLYDDIQDTFVRIVKKNELYDSPLMLEWNTWRAMTMLDGGTVKANLKFDDFGKPLSVASGNLADIVCDYGDFLLSVEVTMASGQRQYETEGEPVGRHLGKLKKESGKPCYCLFIAPTINEASIAHFFVLHKSNISFYGGTSVIVPLPLNIFKKMVEDSYKAAYTPKPVLVKRFFERSYEIAQLAENETQWYEQMKQNAINWLG